MYIPDSIRSSTHFSSFWSGFGTAVDTTPAFSSMMSGDIGKAFLEVIALNTGTIVAIIGAVVSFIAWTMMGDSMFGAGLFGFGLAHIVLGILDAMFDRRAARAGNVE